MARTTTRRWIRKDDIYYDGISYGTPAGQILFLWVNDNWIKVFHTDDYNNEKMYDCDNVEQALKIANGIIKNH